MKTSIKTIAALFVAVTLAACGGGGGSDSGSTGGSGSPTATTPATTTPKISTQPASIALTSGSTGVLTVVASGSSLTYQWYKDSAAISGATSTQINVSAAGSYYVVVTNTAGSVTSATATVTVAAVSAPAITTQPANLSLTSGNSGVLSIVASGNSLTYQWYKDSAAISGATDAQLSVTTAGSYYVVVSNSGGSVTSSTATVTVAAIAAPAITTQPTGLSFNKGSSGVLSVVASGSSLTYQWYKDSAAISGATAAQLTVSAKGSYYVVVSNSAGSVTSSSATVIVVDLQTSIATASYASGSQEAIAYALVNSERNKCGFGLVAQNTKLDTAAAGHAEYLHQRSMAGEAGSHNEDSSKSGYYAATVGDRVKLAGYTTYASVWENFDYYNLQITSVKSGEGLVRNMLATVYHMVSMLNGNRESGVSVRTDQASAPSGYQYAIMVWLNGRAVDADAQEPGTLLSYPCDGSTDVQSNMGGTETPDPYTKLGFTSGTNIGHPIYWRSASGTTLRLSSAALSAGATSVPVVLMHAADDPNNELGSNQAFVIPTASLADKTSYTLTVTGTVDGVSFTKTITFSTE